MYGAYFEQEVSRQDESKGVDGADTANERTSTQKHGAARLKKRLMRCWYSWDDPCTMLANKQKEDLFGGEVRVWQQR